MIEKNVTEMIVKVFENYDDARDDINFLEEVIEFEGSVPPIYHNFNNKPHMIIGFNRTNKSLDKIIEKVYIKMS